MKYKKLELGTYVFFIILSAGMFIVTRSMGKEGDFPAVISVAMFITAAVCFITRLRATKDILDLTGTNLKLVLITVAILIVYISVIEYIGYVAASVLLAMAVMRLLGYKRILISLAVAAVTAGVCFFVFKILLDVPLPTAFLDL